MLTNAVRRRLLYAVPFSAPDAVMQVEMWLVANEQIDIAEGIYIAQGERILMEMSRKFTLDDIRQLAFQSDFYVQVQLTSYLSRCRALHASCIAKHGCICSVARVLEVWIYTSVTIASTYTVAVSCYVSRFEGKDCCGVNSSASNCAQAKVAWDQPCCK